MPLGFHAADEARRQLARKVGILAEILKIPPAQGIALEIRSRPQHQSHALIFGFLADGGADLFQQFRIPASRRRSLPPGSRSLPGIHERPAYPPRFPACAGHEGPSHIKSAGNAVLRKRLGLPEIFPGAKGNLLFQRHLLQNLFYIHCKHLKRYMCRLPEVTAGLPRQLHQLAVQFAGIARENFQPPGPPFANRFPHWPYDAVVGAPWHK